MVQRISLGCMSVFPSIEDLFNQFREVTLFSKIDL